MQQKETTNKENIELFKTLIGDLEGWKEQLAPNGWANSPYVYLNHPTPQMQYEDSLRTYENLADLFKDKETEPPKLEEFTSNEPTEIDEDYELKDLLGRCLWTIFSNNHDVVNADGAVHYIGSFRGAGGFIAEFLNQHYPGERGFGYMDFYCADMFIDEAIDIQPVYEVLFTRLKKANCDWVYAFPRIHLISFAQEKEEKDQPENYNPEQAMQEELERKEKKKQVAEFQRQLDEDYEARKEDAKYKAPPIIVQAYQKVFGRLPKGFLEE